MPVVPVAANREIVVDGARRLASTLRTAAAGLEDFSKPGGAAARMAATAARTLAPRRTGALAGSISARGGRRVGIITAAAPHARPVHWGAPGRAPRPFLSRAAQATEPVWLRAYENHINDQLKKVKGK